MNRPPDTFVRVQEDCLLAFSTACFEKAGLEHDHAELISRLLVNSDLRGVRSHGSRNVNGYCRWFETGSCNPRPEVRTVHETPTAVVLDGDRTLGYLPMVQATEAAIAKAKELGLGMGLVRHIGHYGSAGHYARICLENGCIGFSVQGYHGGTASQGGFGSHLGYFGNPPISFAIPSGEEREVVLDAATCILADYQCGPEFEALFEQIPAAFFKSIGLTAVASLLGGTLMGSTLPEADEVIEPWSHGGMRGGMVLAIHMDSVVPEAAFKAEVDRVVRDVRETYEPMPGTDRVLLPGAIEAERLEAQRREGICYGEPEQQAAREASERLGVPLPWD